MKTLKLDHELAELVRQGAKTSTWRVFDDKDISEGDEIGLIDKVDPARKDTWKVIPAKVVKVIEKPLGSITASDSDGHEEYKSLTAMLEEFQKYYGPEVSPDTIVKIIHFELKN